jgi:hypothetical protein
MTTHGLRRPTRLNNLEWFRGILLRITIALFEMNAMKITSRFSFIILSIEGDELLVLSKIQEHRWHPQLEVWSGYSRLPRKQWDCGSYFDMWLLFISKLSESNDN